MDTAAQGVIAVAAYTRQHRRIRASSCTFQDGAFKSAICIHGSHYRPPHANDRCDAHSPWVCIRLRRRISRDVALAGVAEGSALGDLGRVRAAVRAELGLHLGLSCTRHPVRDLQSIDHK